MKLSHPLIHACFLTLVATAVGLNGQVNDAIPALLNSNQMDLATDGRRFLLDEASRASFFLIGGLHGDNETPALVQKLDPGGLRSSGYLYAATEMSPWTASRLPIPVWGLDIEAGQPQQLILEFARANPQNEVLKTLSEMTSNGYRRSMAPTLLPLVRQMGNVQDIVVQGMSLRNLLVRTLEVENLRLDPDLSLTASMNRESFMKEAFISNYRRVTKPNADKPKVMLVFGQNHLHRGVDSRGVSTLGNFIAEMAAADGLESFHVALFAAGGKVFLGGLVDADQRKDEPAFEWLASVAKYPVTVFDVRSLRQVLHRKPASTLSAREANLLYWADSYDAIICYREVTPVAAPQFTR
jgi:hypothetical protein